MDRLAEIERRLAALEERASVAPPPDDPGDQFWALHGLEERTPGAEGAVVFSGYVGADPAERLRWQYGRALPDVTEVSWADLAPAFAALGNPVRLTLLQRIFAGTHDVGELAEIEGIGTTGQLYHHLRALTAAGWLRSARRGTYEIVPQRVVPLLVCLVAGGDL